MSKTDRIDAAMLARYGALVTPQIRPVRSDALDTRGARRALIKDRTATLNRQKSLTIPLLKRQAEQRLKQIVAQIAEIDTDAEPESSHRSLGRVDSDRFVTQVACSLSEL
ncbi:hypothetical protein [Mesorhizobium sp. M0085]|uniref:hypothetical protein n=1 Tax=Mesorhizobium sp. M0085 TaxID=2956872 RepID=UPI003337CB72